MARYINVRTGAIIDSPCTISGGDWKNIEDLKASDRTLEAIKIEAEAKEPELKEEDEKALENPDIDGLTRKDIMQELDAFGIKYNPRATKKELYDLMMAGK